VCSSDLDERNECYVVLFKDVSFTEVGGSLNLIDVAFTFEEIPPQRW
jgi:hypothetical protein